jgi:hypothetical protein
MRGQLSLFNNIFSESSNQGTKQRPRNFFLPERNKALVYRYFYWAEIHRLRYEDCLQELENEFYITTTRIITVLSQSNDIISKVTQEQPTLNELQLLFPHFTWKARNQAGR